MSSPSLSFHLVRTVTPAAAERHGLAKCRPVSHTRNVAVPCLQAGRATVCCGRRGGWCVGHQQNVGIWTTRKRESPDRPSPGLSCLWLTQLTQLSRALHTHTLEISGRPPAGVQLVNSICSDQPHGDRLSGSGFPDGGCRWASGPS